MTRLVLTLLVITSTLAVAAEPPAPSVPADVRDASAHVREWLNTLRGKTEADVAKIIGNDYEKDTWPLQGKKELKIRYKFDKESTLVLLFKGEKVVKSEIYVMSEGTK
jgi:hypothetical protein